MLLFDYCILYEYSVKYNVQYQVPIKTVLTFTDDKDGMPSIEINKHFDATLKK